MNYFESDSGQEFLITLNIIYLIALFEANKATNSVSLSFFIMSIKDRRLSFQLSCLTLNSSNSSASSVVLLYLPPKFALELLLSSRYIFSLSTVPAVIFTLRFLTDNLILLSLLLASPPGSLNFALFYVFVRKWLSSFKNNFLGNFPFSRIQVSH